MPKTYQPAPGEVLRFAEHVARKVRTSRKARLKAGKITDAEAAHDVARADALADLAKRLVLGNAPLG